MNIFQQRALEGASGLELVVALYDGIVSFMREAVAAVERDDVGARRVAVRRAMDIVIHLQATLKMDAGAQVASALAEFYAVIFALMLQGSTETSLEKFEQVISQVLNVRGAWQQVALGSKAEISDEISRIHRAQQFNSGSTQKLEGGSHLPAAAVFDTNPRPSYWMA